MADKTEKTGKTNKINKTEDTTNGKTGKVRKNPFLFILNRIIYPTSLYFTVIILILYIGGSALDHGNTNMIPRLSTVLIVLAFSFILNVANIILTVKRLHISLRIVIHYLLTAVSFFVLFVVSSDYEPSNGFTIILVLAYTLIYALICAAVFAVRSARKRRAADSAEYKSIYDERI